jgi:hypothetical protein
MRTHVAPLAGSRGKKKSSARIASNAETVAAFRAARTQHCAAAARFHSHAKSMRALAASSRWLVGAFHDLCLGLVKSPLLQPLTSSSVKSARTSSAVDLVTRQLVDNSAQKR